MLDAHRKKYKCKANVLYYLKVINIQKVKHVTITSYIPKTIRNLEEEVLEELNFAFDFVCDLRAIMAQQLVPHPGCDCVVLSKVLICSVCGVSRL